MKQIISRIELFKSLGADDYDFLMKNAEQKDFDKNDVFFEKGQEAQNLYVLTGGKVKIYDERKITQREEIIDVLTTGNVFDLTALIIRKQHALSAQALEPGGMIVFPHTTIEQLFEKSQIFAKNCSRLLAWLNNRLIEEMSDLSLSTTKERLAKYLLKEYKQQKRAASFRLPLNQSQIASFLGTVREIVSRDLASLKKARVIESKQGEIAVLNAQELAQIAEGYSFHENQ